MRSRRTAYGAVAIGAASVVVAGLLPGTAHASPPPAQQREPVRSAGADDGQRSIAPAQRNSLMGKGWERSRDRAWTTSGDAQGFHLLVADGRSGYAWRTAASLSEPGFDADAWIGNACVTGSGRRALVAYAPRTFTNKAELMARGAFAAVVDLGTGKVTKLNRQVSLAYFSPGCGTGETGVFTQAGGESKNATRLITVDAVSGRPAEPITLKGQVTSAVPVGDAIVAADSARLVRIDRSGRRTLLARTDQVPFQIKPDADGGVVFLDRPTVGSSGEPQGQVKRLALGKGNAKASTPQVLAQGPLTKLDLSASATGQVFVTGQAKPVAALPRVVQMRSHIPMDAVATTRGEAMVTRTMWADGKDSRIGPREATDVRPVKIGLRILGTGKDTEFQVKPGGQAISGGVQGTRRSPALPAPSTARKQRRRTTGTVEPDRTCSVPRNDPGKQTMQPKPRQVEWAVDQAITGNLNKHISRPANWKNLGMGAYQPQTLFPLQGLSGGGRIPAQIMLGVTAQESNMWQASRTVVPGVTGNPLIGNYYGVVYTPDGQQTDPWAIDWSKADCGYGIAQVTDGMRMHGKEKDHEVPKTDLQQQAVALDYTANIAAGVNILVEKWNQTRADGLIIDNGKPEHLENWFFALWAYNSGYHTKGEAPSNGGTWGLGWTNNPADPLWKANRPPFLEGENGGDDYTHAKNPQDWPYQEKVLGWAARPLEGLESPGKTVAGYRAAWWTNNDLRHNIKPPEGLFCTSANQCDPGKISNTNSNDPGMGPCGRADLHCWWTQPASWQICNLGRCGHEILRFDSTYAEEADGTAYPPNCSTAGLPAGSLIVDDLPSGTPVHRPGCGGPASTGSFTLDFATASSRIDLHQLGAGLGGHFWFSHTRSTTTHPDGNRMKTTGTWNLGQNIGGWARVMVHLPDHGAHTRQAAYTVHGTDSSSPVRVRPQRIMANRWVSLGVFRFTGAPKVSLSTDTPDGNGDEDVAWDAVAFHKLSGKPRHSVVAMGDSYSSGEGASVSGGGDYYRETDIDGGRGYWRAACHRSRHAWSRRANLSDSGTPIGQRADDWDPSVDYQFIACSGAETKHVLPESVSGPRGSGRSHFGELPQISQGYLDNNTTLVTLSIGGNDAGFSDIVKKCIYGSLGLCQNSTLEGDDKPLKDAEPERINGSVRQAIEVVLSAIHKYAPNARIVLMGYPRLWDGDGQCIPGIGTSEAPWMNDMADVLAGAMKTASENATRAGAPTWFSDPRARFAGQAVCGDPETVHGIVLDKTPGDDPSLLPPNSAQSFHPKIDGTAHYAAALNETLRQMGL
ncbi:golvesin C-terminal-like domain-containing protein [Actinomadura litoris]|uniref:golvesin C-terminal-like domain-containing protein n=1 Tax=Actinomadura litoris TaxID=2678616 RepID=UPI001FA7846C|nr:GDSL-type esterase/lipase family protein [Actinomadura litoris]